MIYTNVLRTSEEQAAAPTFPLPMCHLSVLDTNTGQHK